MVIVLGVLVIGGAIWFASSRRSSTARRPADSPAFPAPPAGLLTARPVDGSSLAAGEIVVRGLTKQYRDVTAVRDLTFSVAPGRVTGFLGPNGAGKTTTLRMILGLVTPTAGIATVGGVRYADIDAPVCRVGALLEASAAHSARTGRNHLRIV